MDSTGIGQNALRKTFRFFHEVLNQCVQFRRAVSHVRCNDPAKIGIRIVANLTRFNDAVVGEVGLLAPEGACCLPFIPARKRCGADKRARTNQCIEIVQILGINHSEIKYLLHGPWGEQTVAGFHRRILFSAAFIGVHFHHQAYLLEIILTTGTTRRFSRARKRGQKDCR